MPPLSMMRPSHQMSRAFHHREPMPIQSRKLVTEQAKPMRHQADDLLDLKRGQITLDSTASRSTHLIAPYLPRFRKEYPGIGLTLVEETTVGLERMALEGSLDIIVSLQPINTEDFDYEELFSEELLLALPEGHALAQNYGLHAHR